MIEAVGGCLGCAAHRDEEDRDRVGSSGMAFMLHVEQLDRCTIRNQLRSIEFLVLISRFSNILRCPEIPEDPGGNFSNQVLKSVVKFYDSTEN